MKRIKSPAMAQGVRTVTDNQIRAALIQTGGQPTKAAQVLGISYASVWQRCKENPELEAVKEAYRSAMFDRLTSLSSVAAITGVIPVPVSDDDGTIIRDTAGRIVFKEVAVPIKLRLKHAMFLMNLFKSYDNIKPQLQINQDTEIDLTGLDDDILKKLVEVWSDSKR